MFFFTSLKNISLSNYIHNTILSRDLKKVKKRRSNLFYDKKKFKKMQVAFCHDDNGNNPIAKLISAIILVTSNFSLTWPTFIKFDLCTKDFQIFGIDFFPS